ncbi:hypothetical protein [Avibacterium paragallinarum]|nr:hypothetical protein [Avibacterium paragallinarum]
MTAKPVNQVDLMFFIVCVGKFFNIRQKTLFNQGVTGKVNFMQDEI